MKICVFGNKFSTEKLAEGLLEDNLEINCLVTLNEEIFHKHKISGSSSKLYELASKNRINLYSTIDYSLKSELDKKFFHSQKFDLGLSTGWQRLIPKDILDSFSYGIFGWHGSGFELPNGRGRSPMNWSLRLGMNAIFHNCFKYDEDVDNGGIYHTEKFSINDADYISDLQNKALKHIILSSKNLIRDITNDKFKLSPQLNHPSIFFPKLNEESGLLECALLSQVTARNIIRSCSRPFPGAFFFHKNKKIRIWQAENLKHQNKIDTNEGVFIREEILYFSVADGWLVSKDFECL